MFCLGAVLDGAALFASLSSSFACPIHCHPSAVLPFVAGLSIGFVGGAAFGFWLFWICLRPFLGHPPSTGPVAPPWEPPSPVSVLAARSRRLSAYLHE